MCVEKQNRGQTAAAAAERGHQREANQVLGNHGVGGGGRNGGGRNGGGGKGDTSYWREGEKLGQGGP